MRTRAIFYGILSLLILAGVLVLDLIAHSYTAMQGPVLELVRAGLQGAAMLWLARAAEVLFFRTSAISRSEEIRRASNWPVTLVQRFSLVLGISVLLAFAPFLFTLSLPRPPRPSPFAVAPGSFSTVISIDILGAIWLVMLVALIMSFWQLVFVRQSAHFARRRFIGWSTASVALALFTLWQAENVVPTGALGVSILSVLVLATALAALLLGYRLPWLPHVTKEDKRKLLLFTALNVLLASSALLLFGGDKIVTDVIFERYALFWQMIAISVFGTLAIYFALVFFSTFFSLSSTELVQRKSAEVQSLAKLTRFSSDILSSELLLDLPRLAEQITALACEATESDSAWLELQSNSFAPTGTAMNRAADNGGEDVIRSYVGIGEHAAEYIMTDGENLPAVDDEGGEGPRAELERSRKAFVLKRVTGSKQYLFPTAEQARDNRELRSLVAVPLLRKDEVRGGLYVAKHREDGFDDDDLTVLTAFTDVASLALETARLLQDSIEKQKFDGELRAARLMQKSLQPTQFPDIPGFDVYVTSIPAYDVGGDYYDFSELWDGSAMVAIGDVSGKGISASLYMAETKGVVQALAPMMASMTALLESTNDALLHNSPTQSSLRRSFVTLGLISVGKKGVRYARAGHTPLLIVRADGTYGFVQPRGMAVGLMKKTDFADKIEEMGLDIVSGDILVLYSDGITDARDPMGQELGYERLARLVAEHRDLRARDLTLRLLSSIAEFTESANFDDDATLVVMKCL